MDYSKAEQVGNDIVLTGVKHFDPAQTLDNGQAFRWAEIKRKTEADENLHSASVFFSGIAYGRQLDLCFSNDTLTLKNTDLTEFETTWKTYFDFTRSYSKIHEIFSSDETNEGNKVLKQAINAYPGLRMLRQDIWETLISFILSQNSNIPRIKKMIQALCENFGEKLPAGGYCFPTPQAIAALKPGDLHKIKSGYRAAYIIDAATRFADGRFNPVLLEEMPSDVVYQSLLSIHGVGPKVADCVLLFGFGRVERFPLDVWIKRVMAKLYPSGFPRGLEKYSGIAQQFLFHYARLHKEQFV